MRADRWSFDGTCVILRSQILFTHQQEGTDKKRHDPPTMWHETHRQGSILRSQILFTHQQEGSANKRYDPATMWLRTDRNGSICASDIWGLYDIRFPFIALGEKALWSFDIFSRYNATHSRWGRNLHARNEALMTSLCYLRSILPIFNPREGNAAKGQNPLSIRNLPEQRWINMCKRWNLIGIYAILRSYFLYSSRKKRALTGDTILHQWKDSEYKEGYKFSGITRILNDIAVDYCVSFHSLPSAEKSYEATQFFIQERRAQHTHTHTTKKTQGS